MDVEPGEKDGLPFVPVLAGARVGVPRHSGTKGTSEGCNPMYTEKYKLRLVGRGGGFLPHGVVHRGSAIEINWSLQQLLVARSVTDGHRHN